MNAPPAVNEAIEHFERVVGMGAPGPGRRVPTVTLTWAQTIDGSIARTAGRSEPLSGPDSAVFTHYLRSRHDAILVGVNTVIADDPRLTTRLCAGSSPRAVVLDSQLRVPTGSRIFTVAAGEGRPAPIVVTTRETAEREPGNVRSLQEIGAAVSVVPATSAGWVDLGAAVAALGELGIRTIMVEGGATVIRSALEYRIADVVAVTVCPRIMNGYRALDTNGQEHDSLDLRLSDSRWVACGEDIVITGRPGATG